MNPFYRVLHIKQFLHGMGINFIPSVQIYFIYRRGFVLRCLNRFKRLVRYIVGRYTYGSTNYVYRFIEKPIDEMNRKALSLLPTDILRELSNSVRLLNHTIIIKLEKEYL